MKKFIINLGIFALFAILFYIVVMPIWSSFLPPSMAKNVRSCMGCYGHTFSRVKDAQKIKDVDVLIVGSSHAYRGIDPRILQKNGISAYNLGSSAQTPINTKMLLHQYLEKINPKLVVYEAYVGTLTIDGLESSLDLLSNNKIDENSYKMAKEMNNFMVYNTLLFSSFRQMMGLNEHFNEPTSQNEDTYIPSTGFVETKFRKNKFPKENQKEYWDLNPNQRKIFEQNINFIKNRGINVYIIQAPITDRLYKMKSNNREVDKYMSSLGVYKNYQKEFLLNDTIHFYDSNHMNQNAVILFTELLAEDLKKIFRNHTE